MPVIKKVIHLALVLFASIGWAGDMEPQVLSADGGRFVFGQISSFRRDQYLLDTQSGRVWEIVTAPDSSRIFQEVRYIALTGIEGYPFAEKTSGPRKPDTSWEVYNPRQDLDSAEIERREAVLLNYLNRDKPKKK